MPGFSSMKHVLKMPGTDLRVSDFHAPVSLIPFPRVFPCLNFWNFFLTLSCVQWHIHIVQHMRKRVNITYIQTTRVWDGWKWSSTSRYRPSLESNKPCIISIKKYIIIIKTFIIIIQTYTNYTYFINICILI